MKIIILFNRIIKEYNSIIIEYYTKCLIIISIKHIKIIILLKNILLRLNIRKFMNRKLPKKRLEIFHQIKKY